MFEQLARRNHLRQLRHLRTQIKDLKIRVQTLTAERGVILAQAADLKDNEPGLIRRFAAGARTVVSVGVAVAGGIAAYQLGHDSGIAGQMASQAVGDKSFEAAEAIGRGGPRTVAEYDKLMASLRKRLEELKEAIIVAQRELAGRTAELKELRAAGPGNGVSGLVLLGLLVLAGAAGYLYF